jgi:hypothetical protein
MPRRPTGRRTAWQVARSWLDPQVDQLAKGLQARAGVLAVGDLGPQASLDLLGLAVAAVDLARELSLLARQGVKAGVDDDLPTTAARPDGHCSAPSVRASIVDLSLTAIASGGAFAVGRDGIEPPNLPVFSRWTRCAAGGKPGDGAGQMESG